MVPSTTQMARMEMKIKASVEKESIIFKSPDKAYLAFTNSSGIATATGIKTEKPPIHNRIVHILSLEFHYRVSYNSVVWFLYSSQDQIRKGKRFS